MKRLINQVPGTRMNLLLGLLPFALLLVAYLIASQWRLSLNPNDKLLPAPATLAASIWQLAAEADVRTGAVLLWTDTWASLQRLLAGVGVSAVGALVIGVLMGTLPLLKGLLSPLVAALSMVPPMALLPILFIVFGLDELSKIVLIVFGVMPYMIRDLVMRVAELPQEQLVKAQTLGATTWQIILRVVLPQVLPRLIDSLRLSLGPAWLFLIAAEAVASTDGLGYRIFLVRRYLSMDVILPYVAWITLLAWFMDTLLRRLSQRWFRWQQC